MRDELRSLRLGLALVGVLAAAAIGVALWALLDAQADEQRRAGASAAQVRALERRVDALRADVARAPSSSEVAELRAGQQSLAEMVKTLANRVDDVEETAVTLGRVEASANALERRVERLEQRVDEIDAQPPAGS